MSSSLTRVLLSFDIEDGGDPTSESALGDLLSILQRNCIRASFLLTGDKLRNLVARKEHGILGGLMDHDIGFHSSKHSKHPTIPEYTKDAGWESSLALLRDYEGDDIDFFARTLGCIPSTFACPGDVWVPYIAGFCRDVGIKSEAYSPVELPGWKPASYMGVVNFGSPTVRYDPERQRDSLETPYSSREKGGDLVIIRLHPTRFARGGWWDSEYYLSSYSEAARTSRIYSNAEVGAHLDMFEVFLVSLREDYEFTTYGDICRSMVRRPVRITSSVLTRAIHAIEDGVLPVIVEGEAFSFAEIFYALVYSVCHYVDQGALPMMIAVEGDILGPLDEGCGGDGDECVLSWRELVGLCRDQLKAMDDNKAMKPATECGGNSIAAGDLMNSLMLIYQDLVCGRRPRQVPIRCGFSWPPQIEDIFISTFPSLWKWPVLPDGFTMPHELHLARNQIWTLKPILT